MRNPFIPIILLILSAATYFAFIAPFWQDVGTIKVEQEEAAKTIEQGEKLKTLVADIAAKVRKFEERDPDGRIGAILPLETDEILLLNDISALVGNQGLEAKELTLSSSDDEAAQGGARAVSDGDTPRPAGDGEGTTGEDDRIYRTVSFSVSTTYPQFIILLREIEQNLVLFEIEDIEFVASAGDSGGSGSRGTSTARSSGAPVSDYSITLRTVSVR